MAKTPLQTVSDARENIQDDVETRIQELRDEITLDLSQTKLVDHSVMEKLHQLEADFAARGKHLSVTGTDDHTPLSRHPLAARRIRNTTDVPVRTIVV